MKNINCFGALLVATILVATILAVSSASPVYSAENDETSAVTTVPQVDLSRYVGLWYEVAKIPNKFQDQCARGTTAEYTLREDGRITVLNQCIKENGELDDAEGEAKIVDSSTNAKLKVSFVSFLGWRPFWGDYWVIGLDDQYQWVVVGTPDRKYGWVLARKPQLDESTMEMVFEVIERNGYTRGVFEMSDP